MDKINTPEIASVCCNRRLNYTFKIKSHLSKQKKAKWPPLISPINVDW